MKYVVPYEVHREQRPAFAVEGFEYDLSIIAFSQRDHDNLKMVKQSLEYCDKPLSGEFPVAIPIWAIASILNVGVREAVPCEFLDLANEKDIVHERPGGLTSLYVAIVEVVLGIFPTYTGSVRS
jgi:hypothetical protein